MLNLLINSWMNLNEKIKFRWHWRGKTDFIVFLIVFVKRNDGINGFECRFQMRSINEWMDWKTDRISNQKPKEQKKSIIWLKIESTLETSNREESNPQMWLRLENLKSRISWLLFWLSLNSKIDSIILLSLNLNSLSVRMKRSISETLSLVFAEESAVTESYMVYLITRTLAVQTMPFLVWCLAFSLIENKVKDEKPIDFHLQCLFIDQSVTH